MKLAVPYENGNIYQHFGHTEQFKVYVVEDNTILSSEVVPTLGSGHGALAGFLQELGIDTLICGGIGAGAKNALAEVGIQLYGGVSGSADTAVQSFLDRTLSYNPDVACNHHHEGDHACGSHGCGTHSCH
ncbi:MAG: NifB/NifX family molybdenum-iron cluster-binding protein [Oscillospiraceae bacterium]|jgi:predicted Fe-Mo cluster-binding NifX family protein